MPSFDLASIKTNAEARPPIIVLHGQHGVGKSTFGASAPSPIVICTEDGMHSPRLRRVPQFPLCKYYRDVLQCIETLLGGGHDFETVMLDSLDWTEPLVQSATAFEHGKESIEDFDYGKGYTFADEKWRELFQGLGALRDEAGMAVIVTAHTAIKPVKLPGMDQFDRYEIKVHKRVGAIVQEWADVIGFAFHEMFTSDKTRGKGFRAITTTDAVGTGRRMLGIEHAPQYEAKNRLDLTGDAAVLPLDWNAFVNAYAAAEARYAPGPSLDELAAAASPAAALVEDDDEQAAADEAEALGTAELYARAAEIATEAKAARRTRRSA